VAGKTLHGTIHAWLWLIEAWGMVIVKPRWSW